MYQISKRLLLEAGKNRERARETRLECLETELDTALTLTKVAATSYSMGRDEQAASAAHKAHNTVDLVADRLNELRDSSKTEYLTGKVAQVREAIANLQLGSDTERRRRSNRDLPKNPTGEASVTR